MFLGDILKALLFARSAIGTPCLLYTTSFYYFLFFYFNFFSPTSTKLQALNIVLSNCV